MRGKLSWMLLSLMLMGCLQGCAAQRSVAVVAPCPEIPPLPERLQTVQFPSALQKLNDYLTTHGEPALQIPSP